MIRIPLSFRPFDLFVKAGCLAGALLLVSPAFAQDSSDVVATVNGRPVTNTEVQTALTEFGPAFGNMSDEQKREAVIGLLIDVKLLANAAREAGLDKTEDYDRAMAFLSEKYLMETYLAQEAEKAITDEAIQRVYDETIKNSKPETEIRARHILVESEDEAKTVRARLDAGEDFAELAKELSKDPGSGARGGDLGYFSEGQMVPVFQETADATAVGEVSAPFQSDFGWHVLKVEDKREKPLPTLDQVRDQIVVYLERRAQQETVMRIREGAKIERKTAPAGADGDAPSDAGETPKN